MNKVILVGRLTRDPDLRYPSSNIPVANFTLAIDRPFTNQSGNRDADFINVTAFRKQAENLKKYVGKGSMVSVEGVIRTSRYDGPDGKTVFRTDIVAENVRFISTNRPSENSSPVQSGFMPDAGQSAPVPSFAEDNDPFADFGSNVEITDDLPF